MATKNEKKRNKTKQDKKLVEFSGYSSVTLLDEGCRNRWDHTNSKGNG